MAEDKPLSGPDLKSGAEFGKLTENEPFPGHFKGEAVVLVRQGDYVFAIAGTCTHYGGLLAEGLLVGNPALAQSRWTVAALTPTAIAILRHDQCVLPSAGFCCVFFKIRACTEGVALRGRLPRCWPSSPSMRASSKRARQRAIVGRDVFSSASTAL
jgi:hypothetical protein